MKLSFSIRLKFLLLSIVIVIIANLTVSLRSISISTNVVQGSTEINMRNQASTAARLVEDVINQEFSILDALAQIPDVGDLSVSLKEKTDLLTNIKNMNPSKYNNIGYCDVDGKSLVGPMVMDFSKRDLYLNATKGKRYASEPSMSSFQPGLWLMYYSVPVQKNNKFAGAVLSVVEGNDLDEIAKGIDIGGGFHPYIVDRKTKTIIGTAERSDNPEDAQNNKSLEALMDKVASGSTGYLSYVDPVSNKPMIASYCPINTDVVQWGVICPVPAELYLGGIQVIKVNSLISLVFAMVISIVLASILITMILKPLIHVSKSMDEISSGNADLSKRIKVQSNDEVGHLVNGFNSFSNKLQGIVQGLLDSNANLTEVGEALDNSSVDTGNSINEILENISDVHKQIDLQSQSVHETAGAVNEIASNIESLEKMISKQSSSVTDASSAVEQMIGNINTVNESVDQMAMSFGDLTNSAKEGTLIQEEVNLKIEEIRNQSNTLQEANIAIASIAEQTNLLAMNAAIEAAHAGDAGKGFSVVADEIRKLSETSSAQSKTIGNQLTEIQTSIQNVVDACNRSSYAFESMTNRISMTDDIVKRIKNVMEAQTEGSRQIDATLHVMNDSTEEVRIASQEMALGNKAILEEVSVLQDATYVMKKSMQIMSSNAEKITETGNTLAAISDRMQDSISEIGLQIDQFKV